MIILIRDKKLYYISLAGLVAVLCGSVAFMSWYNSSRIVDEKVELSENTMMAIVFADSEDLALNDVSVEVDLNESLMVELETSAQEAFNKSTQLYIKEQIEKRKEEERLKKEKELRDYYASLSATVIDTCGDAVFTYNPYVKSNLSVEQYNKILEGTGLAGCGESYYNMEQTYNVNGLFALSVACLESGYGKYKANTNNFYGMRSSKGWMAFETPDANIQYFGKLMNKSCYYGKDILGIGATYCPGTYQDWAGKVKSIMSLSFNKLS